MTDHRNLRVLVSFVFAAAVVAAAATGCSSSHGGSTEPTPVAGVLKNINVQLSTQGSVPIGTSGTATAQGTDGFGTAVALGPVSWSSSATTVATVGGGSALTTTYTTTGAGTANITAAAAGVSGNMSITVTSTHAGSAIITPPAVSFKVGSAPVNLTFTVLDASGNPLPSSPPPVWSASDSTKIHLNAFGTVTAVAVGSSTVTAQAWGLTATCQVTVTP